MIPSLWISFLWEELCSLGSLPQMVSDWEKAGLIPRGKFIITLWELGNISGFFFLFPCSLSSSLSDPPAPAPGGPLAHVYNHHVLLHGDMGFTFSLQKGIARETISVLITCEHLGHRTRYSSNSHRISPFNKLLLRGTYG